ncbi:hypothetical protein DICVIV_11529 [Dictyocaulus viviparus]|uniref:Uncharacterized protein n=1 Tax=Dictyocaulus viviparus TaxID=29172 RepID=A0A0D8XJG3_DICVI|nr:hypothetical protein DICVIV_11529 [Dictyocaulus viviparus]
MEGGGRRSSQVALAPVNGSFLPILLNDTPVYSFRSRDSLNVIIFLTNLHEETKAFCSLSSSPHPVLIDSLGHLASFAKVMSLITEEEPRAMTNRYSPTTNMTNANQLDRRELLLFIGIYTFCVIFLVCMYEFLMPVFNNPNYPYYNNVPDYTFRKRTNQ